MKTMENDLKLELKRLVFTSVDLWQTNPFPESYAEMEPAHISAEMKENHRAKEMIGDL